MTNSSMKLVGLLVISCVLGFGYEPIAAFIGRTITHLAQIVGGLNT